MKSQVLRTVWCYISGEAARGNLKLVTLGSERVQLSLNPNHLQRLWAAQSRLSLPVANKAFCAQYVLLSAL